MCIELKIKSKHLGVESQIIRSEVDKLKSRIKRTKKIEQIDFLQEKVVSLSQHRRWEVRNENRATFLARAYIAGKPCSYSERKRNDEMLFRMYIVPRIVAMVSKYHKRVTSDEIYAWSKT